MRTKPDPAGTDLKSDPSVPAQPSNGFFSHWPSLIINGSNGENSRADESASLIEKLFQGKREVER